MSVQFKTLKDKVVVEFPQTENKTAGGIYLPDNADKEKPQTGKVVAIGTDEEVTKNIKVGDEIMFGKYSGTEVSIDDKKYLVIKLEDILIVK